MKKKFRIGKLTVGQDHKALIVAELSGNHGGKIQNAKKLIKLAKSSGADAVKLQSYTADSITLNSKRKDFALESTSPWSKYKYFWDLYKIAQTPLEWHKELFSYANKVGIEIFSSPFDEISVDHLEKLKCPAYKIASPEINHFPLLKKVAKTKKPVIFSTGLATFKEITEAIRYLKKNGSTKIIILKCTSSYPSNFEDLNLKTIGDLAKRFNIISGFSDHSRGRLAPVVACALGAKVIEKHFMIKNSQTVDSFFSLNPIEFKKMVNEIRDCEKSLGKITYNIPKSSFKSLNGKRSIYICQDIKKGEIFTLNNIKVVRPRYSLSPKYYEFILKNKIKAKKFFLKGDRLTLKDIGC